jgi:glycosyltransferase involved in cell wall biosynthesis
MVARHRRNRNTKNIQTQEWSIGIYEGSCPFEFAPHPLARNPVLTRKDVTDCRALFVADPFMIRVSDKWFMFFEIWNDDRNRGDIGLATSSDGLTWKYEGIVLQETFHLSYPYVFEWQNEIYMVPETFEAHSVRLYRAARFPTQWQHVATLLEGPFFVDSSLFHFDKRWWLFTEANPAARYDTLRLFLAENLLGPWREHPASPIIAGDPHVSRPAGRVVLWGDKIIRYAQDCYPVYGTRVRAFEVTELTPERYNERAIEHEILGCSNDGWNSSGMHQIDPHVIADGQWIACVDGWRPPVDPLIRERNTAGISYASFTDRARIVRAMRIMKPALGSALRSPSRDRRKVISSLVPDCRPVGNALLFHENKAFLFAPGEPIPASHTHYWETLQIARTLLDFGYAVDVVHFQNSDFTPEKDYRIAIDTRNNIERISPLLDRRCIKILHGDTSHILFHDAAEISRLLALQQRRGVTLKPRRWEPPNLCIEHADCGTILGNEATLGTYRYAQKPLYRLYVPSAARYPAPMKNFDSMRRKFLWFGSGGMVHKGVDLLLEAFADMPDMQLVLCGPVLEETDFVDAYRRELFEAGNIRVTGWLDVESIDFQAVLDDCVALVYPSCSEGQAGAVVTCLHAGIIPVVSAESGVDVDGFGLVLPSCSVSDIQASVRTIAELSAPELRNWAQHAWETARAVYTRERYATRYREILEAILAGRVAPEPAVMKPVQPVQQA